MHQEDWMIEGSAGEAMHGTTHHPEGVPRGAVLVAHGFKGYKDYGMFPWITQRLAELGWLSHRFNFSHSGMLSGDGVFERPDLFECDSWNTQVEDLAILASEFRIDGMPLALVGHSRGGVACLLAVGRKAFSVDRLVSLSAPSTCNPIPKETQEELLRVGYLDSPSSRTDQMLRVGKCFLQEQIDDPEGHDLLSLIATIEAPILIIHGESDPTVPASAGDAITKSAKNATHACIPNADHVFNTPNPFSVDAEPSIQLQSAWDSMKTCMSQ